MRLWLSCSAAVARAARRCSPQDTKKEIQKYQQMIADGSPVELFELEGEALWKKPQGPKNVSLEKCDLGQGPGVLKGAYARLPRYFKDADRVMDLETRLLHCMTTLQGRSREEATKRVFGNEEPALRDGVPLGLRRRASRAACKLAAGTLAPEGEGSLRARQKRSSSTAPAAGTSRARAATARTASASACRTCRCSPSRVRAADHGHLAGVPRLEQPVQDHAVAHQRLLPADALSRSRTSPPTPPSR